jgi:putative exosortase-associated protein (TIGR04073 family)
MPTGSSKCNLEFQETSTQRCFTAGGFRVTCTHHLKSLITMRSALSLLAVVGIIALTGCAGPENKFGRGVNNMTEIVRLGDMNRSVEQTMLWDGPSQLPTGIARGFTRTVTRTGIGVYEVITFPLPPYGPLLTPKSRLYPDPSMRTRKYPWGGLELPEHPVFPDAYQPGYPAGPLFETDESMGFSGGDIAPSFPGSKFRIH